MSEDRRDILEVLRYELNFLEQGGYRRNVQQGRKVSPFLSTLSCLNFGEPLRPHTCHECFLFDFVPEGFRTEDVPCHFIPLDEVGNSVATLLKSDDPGKLESTLKIWLRKTISRLEKEQGQLASTADRVQSN